MAAFAEPPLEGGTLVVEQTGVSKPVATMLRKAKPKASLRLVTVSSGQQAALDGGGWLVPREELVGVMQVLLQGRRIVVAPSLAHSQLLVRELVNFKAKVTGASELAVEAWREGEHDDLVLACAVAAWKALSGASAKSADARHCGYAGCPPRPMSPPSAPDEWVAVSVPVRRRPLDRLNDLGPRLEPPALQRQ